MFDCVDCLLLAVNSVVLNLCWGSLDLLWVVGSYCVTLFACRLLFVFKVVCSLWLVWLRLRLDCLVAVFELVVG